MNPKHCQLHLLWGIYEEHYNLLKNTTIKQRTGPPNIYSNYQHHKKHEVEYHVAFEDLMRAHANVHI